MMVSHAVTVSGESFWQVVVGMNPMVCYQEGYENVDVMSETLLLVSSTLPKKGW